MRVSLGFALKSTKLLFPGDTGRLTVLHNRSGWLSRQCHRLGRFPAEAFGLSRTMRAHLVSGKIVSSEVTSVHRRFVSRLTSQCVRMPQRVSREDTERRSRSPWRRFVQGGWEIYDCTWLVFHGCHCTLLQRCGWKNPAFLNYCLQNCTLSSVISLISSSNIFLISTVITALICVKDFLL